MKIRHFSEKINRKEEQIKEELTDFLYICFIKTFVKLSISTRLIIHHYELERSK